MNSVIIGIGVLASIVVALDIVALIGLWRRIRRLEKSGVSFHQFEPEMTASEPHGEPPPAPQSPRHSPPATVTVVRTDTVDQRKVTPADLNPLIGMQNVEAPWWIDQSSRPRPITVDQLLARHRAEEVK